MRANVIAAIILFCLDTGCAIWIGYEYTAAAGLFVWLSLIYSPKGGA